MDKTIPCFCAKVRVNVDDATLVLNGVPICNRACLERAEKLLTNKKDTVRVNRRFDVV